MEKKSRVKNYTLEEESLLINLVIKYKDILENKKSDVVMWREKEKCWENLASIYNSNGLYFRTAKHLRAKYDNMKKVVRKKSARLRQEMLKTGGGSIDAPQLSAEELKIKNMILISCDGLPNVYDSDVTILENHSSPMVVDDGGENLLPTTSSEITQYTTLHYNASNEEGSEIGDIEGDDIDNTWAKWNTVSLKTPVHKLLRVEKRKAREVETNNMADLNLNMDQNLVETVLQGTSTPIRNGNGDREKPIAEPEVTTTGKNKKAKKMGRDSLDVPMKDLVVMKMKLVKSQLEVSEEQKKNLVEENRRAEEVHILKIEMLRNEERQQKELHDLKIKLLLAELQTNSS